MGCGASKQESQPPAKDEAPKQRSVPAENNSNTNNNNDNTNNAEPAPVAEAPQKASESAPTVVVPEESEAKVEDAQNLPETKTREDRIGVWDAIQARLPRGKTAEDKARRIEIWKLFDKNGTNRLSMDEVDAGCRNILRLDDFTSRLAAVISRAYDKANGMGGRQGSENYVEFLEFRLLLCYIYDFFELQVMFDAVDTSSDGRITIEEFRNALPLIEKWGLKIDDADAVFAQVDKDQSKTILFSEFASWATEKKLDADGDPDNLTAE